MKKLLKLFKLKPRKQLDYVSPIDRFVHAFDDKQMNQLSASQQREMKKHARIVKLRDAKR